MVPPDQRDEARRLDGVEPAPQLWQAAQQSRVRDEGVLRVEEGQGFAVDLLADAEDMRVDGVCLAQGRGGGGRGDHEEEDVDMVPDLAGERKEGGFVRHGRWGLGREMELARLELTWRRTGWSSCVVLQREGVVIIILSSSPWAERKDEQTAIRLDLKVKVIGWQAGAMPLLDVESGEPLDTLRGRVSFRIRYLSRF